VLGARSARLEGKLSGVLYRRDHRDDLSPWISAAIYVSSLSWLILIVVSNARCERNLIAQTAAATSAAGRRRRAAAFDHSQISPRSRFGEAT
jgi:hypothetical protein